jgi:hypothetical protein
VTGTATDGGHGGAVATGSYRQAGAVTVSTPLGFVGSIRTPGLMVADSASDLM